MGSEEPRRRLTTFDALVWTYQRQHAHVYLQKPTDWGLYLFDRQGLVENPRERRPVHPDAAAIHGTLIEPVETCSDRAHQAERGKTGCRRCARLADLLLRQALMGEPPERITIEPRPGPLEPLGGYEERGRTGSVHYTIRTAEVIVIEEPEYRVDGRRRVRQVGVKRTRHEVKFCPLEWRPDPEFILMCDRIADEFDEALAALKVRLRGVKLRSHVLTDLAARVPIAASI